MGCILATSIRGLGIKHLLRLRLFGNHLGARRLGFLAL